MPDGTVAGKSSASRALGRGAGATQGVPGDLRPQSDRTGCTVAIFKPRMTGTFITSEGESLNNQ